MCARPFGVRHPMYAPLGRGSCAHPPSRRSTTTLQAILESEEQRAVRRVDRLQKKMSSFRDNLQGRICIQVRARRWKEASLVRSMRSATPKTLKPWQQRSFGRMVSWSVSHPRTMTVSEGSVPNSSSRPPNSSPRTTPTLSLLRPGRAEASVVQSRASQRGPPHAAPLNRLSHIPECAHAPAPSPTTASKRLGARP